MGGLDSSMARKYASQGSAPPNWLLRSVPGPWRCGSQRCHTEPRKFLVSPILCLPPLYCIVPGRLGLGSILGELVFGQKITEMLKLRKKLIECHYENIMERCSEDFDRL